MFLTRQDFDQSIVIFRLDLKPGDIVVESGTGSGVMSTVSAVRLHPRAAGNLTRAPYMFSAELALFFVSHLFITLL